MAAGFFSKNLAVGAAEIISRLPLLFTAGILARTVGAEAYGTWSVILVYQGLLAAVAGLGLDSSLSRLATVGSPPLAQGYFRLAVRACLLPLGAIAVLTAVLSEPLVILLGVSDSARVLIAASALLVAVTVAEALLSSYLKARERAGHYVALLLIRAIAEIVAVVTVFVLASPDAAAAQLLHYLLLSCSLKIAGYLTLALFNPVGSVSVPDTRRREFLRYGLPMIPAVLLSWFSMQGDRLLLAHLTDSTSLGVYAFGAALAAYLGYVGYAVFPLMLTRSSRLYDARDFTGLRELFVTYQLVMLAAYVAALGAVVPFARDGVVFLANVEFEAAAPALVALALGICVERVFGVYQYVFHLVKRPSWILWLSLLNAALMGLAIAVAATVFGIRAVPWAVLTAVVFFNCVRFGIARHYFALPLPIAAASCVLAAIALASLGTQAIWSWPTAARVTFVGVTSFVAFGLANSALDGRPMLALRSLIARG